MELSDQHHTPRFTLGIQPQYLMNRSLRGPQSRFRRFVKEKENFLTLSGFETRTVKLIAHTVSIPTKLFRFLPKNIRPNIIRKV